ncbi:11-beta-hydroxysteroid dehydrogenase 1B [Amborella trichopoda]|uniref:Uncharacterized protein n=1 Tax=Amborella trichopoda TaxID=13333 RepID=W1P8V2_AMBTC|nr:11-beta-hydroxysteroid dehydrogenase 1B [Amborella trichopoda]ERN06302.1 hypothetical protein AMTR_s00016p00227990 [Amborella trichopoda]|eukprot:XP_006844627.1 11-beta-hydroxysteroid dehydrogenase 1B [Amborella trichopoda]
MGVINNLLSLVLPPTAIVFLSLCYPTYATLKLFLYLISPILADDMRGKVVLITGASSGIGEHMAYQYAKRGARLVLIARREQSLQEVAEKARSLGSPDVIVVHADVTRVDECKRFIDETINHFGRLDHLVNNAGIVSLCMFEEVTDITKLEPVMDVNFWGSVYPTYYAIPHLRKVRGKIVANASAAGWLPTARMSIYNASKAAMINFFDTLRMEVGPEIGITIATPGWIESEMTRGKFLNKEGEMVVNEETREVQVGPMPIGYTQGCAEAIVKGACIGDRNVTEPFWFRVMFWYRLLVPEVMEWCYRLLYVTKPWGSRYPPSKKILYATGAEKVLYPTSIQSEETKSD